MNGRREQVPPGLRPGLPPAAATSPSLLLRVVALLLVLTFALVSPPVASVTALSLPWRPHAVDNRPAAASRGMAPLQEVAAPVAVQQLQSALSGRQPVVEILSPQDDAVLPAGPWTLKLRVRDWPLVDGGPLGLGPHLVVQLDQDPLQIWTRSEGLMPELSPGSHRLTVYAALPWGEVRKSPGAVKQIRLHRTARNPLTLPVSGSPQLLAVSPSGPAAEEPLLLDWLLLDGPLQDVGGSGTQWRLRVSINGDDVLLDQQTPLWLRGWRPGVNALHLELLDAHGDPLNPPFNSLVQEVEVNPTAVTPRWRGERLSAGELAILLGETPPAPPKEQQSRQDGPSSSPEARPPLGDSGAAPLPSGSALDRSVQPIPSEGSLSAGELEPPPLPIQESVERPPSPSQPPPQPVTTAADGDLSLTGPAIQTPAAAPNSPDENATVPVQETPPPQPAARAGSDPAEPLAMETTEAPADEALNGSATEGLNPPDPGAGAAATTRHPPDAMMPPAPSSPANAPPPQAAAPQRSDDLERIRPASALNGRARDLVNDDGTLRRPERRGPLAGLRERLQQ